LVGSPSAEVAEGKGPTVRSSFLARQRLFNTTRASRKTYAWAYCHVPNGCDANMTERIENQIERFAPGFRDCILARHTTSPAQLENYNPNYTGGDITGGASDLRQIVRRPVALRHTRCWALHLFGRPRRQGGGVHGMCGYHAARAAMLLHFDGRGNRPGFRA
jgi:phytoene dehydrogenase-like protein